MLDSSAAARTFRSTKEESILCTAALMAFECASTIPYWVCREPSAGGIGRSLQWLVSNQTFTSSPPMPFSPSAIICSGKPQVSVHLTMPSRIAPVVRPPSKGSRQSEVASSSYVQVGAVPRLSFAEDGAEEEIVPHFLIRVA